MAPSITGQNNNNKIKCSHKPEQFETYFLMLWHFPRTLDKQGKVSFSEVHYERTSSSQDN